MIGENAQLTCKECGRFRVYFAGDVETLKTKVSDAGWRFIGGKIYCWTCSAKLADKVERDLTAMQA